MSCIAAVTAEMVKSPRPNLTPTMYSESKERMEIILLQFCRSKKKTGY